jgi:protein O-GlcNAc transferase
LHKVTPKTIELWSRILLRLPSARLMLKNKSLADKAAANPLREEFAGFGIPQERLILRSGVREHKEHLACYADIDIALDTFPYHGTTTTCEALWMGVPVVTFAGQAHRSRVGASLLAAIGAEELVAHSPEQYVQIACELACEARRLRHYRRELRDRMTASPLRDEWAFAARLEHIFLQALARCGVV